MSDVKKTVEQLLASPEALTAFVEEAAANEEKLAVTEELLAEAAAAADKASGKAVRKNTVVLGTGKKAVEYNVLTPIFTLPGYAEKVFTAADLEEGKVVVHVRAHGTPSREVNIVDYAIEKGIVSPVTI